MPVLLDWLGFLQAKGRMRHDNNGFEHGAMDAAPLRRRPRRLSEVFAQLARDAEGPISIAHITKTLGARAFAPLLVFFSAINLLPLPPGASAFLGLPLLIISAQMVYGNRRTWLPGFLANRSLSAEQFRTMMEKVIPHLSKVERWIRPRYWPFWRRQGDRIIGCLALIMAISVTLPIPGGNWLPAFSSTLLGLSLLERDGILFAIGSAVGVVAMGVVALIIGSAGYAGQAIWGWLV
jgi:hypothetical protein